MAVLKFAPNEPIEIALRFPEGKLVEGRYGDQTMYSLSVPPDHVLYLDNDVAARLNVLEPRKNEPIWACKRWTGKKTDKPQWDFWRDPEQPRKPQPEARVAPPAPAPAAATQPDNYDNTPSISNGHANGNGYSNGHNGHAAARIALPPTKIPMNVAVIEAVRMVQVAMKETGEQWSDQSRQDFASTILIQICREGWVGMWERGGER